MIYASAAFDEHLDLKEEEIERKGRAFILHIERILGAEEGILREAIMKIFMRQMKSAERKKAGTDKK